MRRATKSRVKYLAGDDMLSGRDMYEKTINFRPTHKAILRTNHKPKIRGTDLGIWRRIHYVPYLVTIDDGEKVEHFRQKVLAPEMAGILNWMLAGLADYQQGGLRPPAIVCKATEKYRREMDTVGRWIETTCERSTIGAKLFLSEIHSVYAKWAAEEIGWVASKQKLAEELRAHGFGDDHPRGVTRFKNIRLRDPDE
jgi:putative DNA primase/helicase